MMDVVTLSCQELVELVTDWLEGALDVRHTALFEEHLAACDGCARYVAQLRRTIEATGRLTTDDLSPDAESTLLQAFRDWKRTS